MDGILGWDLWVGMAWMARDRWFGMIWHGIEFMGWDGTAWDCWDLWDRIDGMGLVGWDEMGFMGWDGMGDVGWDLWFGMGLMGCEVPSHPKHPWGGQWSSCLPCLGWRCLWECSGLSWPLPAEPLGDFCPLWLQLYSRGVCRHYRELHKKPEQAKNILKIHF